MDAAAQARPGEREAPAGDPIVRLKPDATVQPATADCSSNAAYASRINSRSLVCAVASTIGRRSAKLRRSPLTVYWREGNVTLRPPPPRRLRSQIENPISFSPSRG